MLDIKFIKENLELVSQNNSNRNIEIDLNRLISVYNKKIELQKELEIWRAEKNKFSKSRPSTELTDKLKSLGKKISDYESKVRLIDEEIISLQYQIPNITLPEVPIGKDENDNKIIKEVGAKTKFDFTPKDHVELGKLHDIIDIETSAKVAGARFNYLKNQAVWLQFALTNYAFDTLTNAEILSKIIKDNNLKTNSDPFIPVIPPYMIKPDVYEKMGRLKIGDEDKYYLPKDNLYLIGSAEHTIGPMFMDKIFKETELPKRFIAISPAFRREAGSYGKDTKGILRVHQFDKIELESFTLAENSIIEQDFIVAIQEYLLKQLNLPYQVIMVCTGDMGTPDARQIDINTWLPGQNMYRETHTADYMSDYQARRLNTKVKRNNGQSEFVHMNDATVFAIGRTLIAILENYQQADGSIKIPTVLQKYLHFDII